MFLMKIEFSLFASLLMIGAPLLARVQAQGLEQALIGMAIEYGAARFRSAGRRLRFAAKAAE